MTYSNQNQRQLSVRSAPPGGAECSEASLRTFPRSSDEKLTGRDIAEVNLASAAGLPGSERLDVSGYLRQLDEWARLVATRTELWLPTFYRSPSDFDNSLARCRMMALVTVLQRDLGVRYDPSCQEGPYCRLDPRTLFIHGLLDGHGGTCVTMPVLYVAIGRRLGYPLYLVQAREHFFVRWEEHGGERFNIEATTLGFTPRDDDHYRRWPKPVRDEDVRSGLFLRNLTPPEELAAFLRERGQCWLDHLRTAAALEAFAEVARMGGSAAGGPMRLGDRFHPPPCGRTFWARRAFRHARRGDSAARGRAAMGAPGPPACPGAVAEDRKQLS